VVQTKLGKGQVYFCWGVLIPSFPFLVPDMCNTSLTYTLGNHRERPHRQVFKCLTIWFILTNLQLNCLLALLNTTMDTLVEDMPSVVADGPQLPDNQPWDDELGLMSQYLGKMGKFAYFLLLNGTWHWAWSKSVMANVETIVSKAPDWPVQGHTRETARKGACGTCVGHRGKGKQSGHLHT
jgi:hypothetical protein